MKLLLSIILVLLLTGLFLYSRILPHRDRLDPRYRGTFDLLYRIFNPVLNGLRSFIHPARVGQNLSVDLAQVVLFLILLSLLQLL